jgi:hypothetical protein
MASEQWLTLAIVALLIPFASALEISELARLDKVLASGKGQ